MKKIPFVKYTSCGNNFVIVDQTETSLLNEAEFSAFAYQATNTNFGVGCDNLLVIQRCTDTSLNAINAERQYWESTPESSQAAFLFRMFEPSGEEALCCGNGLMCIANYLFDEYGIDDTKILTEIPLSTPHVRTIGVSLEKDYVSGGCDDLTSRRLWGWANMGTPRQAPTELATRGLLASLSNGIDVIDEIFVKLQTRELMSYSNESELQLKGYLVFTGEPHLVIFPDQNFGNSILANAIFGNHSKDRQADKANSFGSRFFEHVGTYINAHYKHIFPAGINVNFARIHNEETVENRCFERGINRETLACGTGALAVAYVVQELQTSKVTTIDILPHRCRWHEADACIRAEQRDTGWYLETSPQMLFEGFYHYIPRVIRPNTGSGVVRMKGRQPSFSAISREGTHYPQRAWL
ncbi:diaminopimelate epimerase [Motiliproteus sp. MSK22-1]|uniref:diaminopimelate epimerase n=1 Tax=Motiliproteus sp. MSK22-1 TaxID=1897630 RepID=UPI00097863E8|nr:hypothetical protein [Motiliproteus sp. MSK22-1]OMH32750.1 hypothetical protein BGP75_14590 [Motiliproteus sp. MSK22-1]